MHNPRVILCEKDGHWAVALRRRLNGASVRVYETRSPEDCLDAVQASPTSFVAVELTRKSVDRVYRLMAEIHCQFPQARIVAFSQPGLESLDVEIREAGAVHVVYSPRQLGSVAKLVERHMALLPMPELSLRESVMSRLPWSGQKP